MITITAYCNCGRTFQFSDRNQRFVCVCGFSGTARDARAYRARVAVAKQLEVERRILAKHDLLGTALDRLERRARCLRLIPLANYLASILSECGCDRAVAIEQLNTRS